MTSTFILGPGEEFVQCPYNVAHQITNAKIIMHLEKCRKAYLKGMSAENVRREMKICRHNATHHFPSPEIRFHEERCPDAYSIVRHMAYHNSEEGKRNYQERRRNDATHEEEKFSSYNSSKQPKKVETKPQQADNEWGLEEEDWEAESNGYTPGYDPQQKLKSEFVMYNPSGLTKSERKKFRADVREKVSDMNYSTEPMEFPVASDFEVKPHMADLKLHDNKSSKFSHASHEPTKPSSYSKESTGNKRRDDQSSHSSSRSYYSDRAQSSKSSSSSSYFQKLERSEYSEDDFEGDDPFAK